MNPKILIIDDEQTILKMLTSTLEHHGYNDVKTAFDYNSAISAVSETLFDVIISDIKLGDKTGIDFLREIRRRGIDTPVAFITGYPQIETAIDAVRLGAFDYIRKPFSIKDIVKVIQKMIDLNAEQERRKSNEQRLRAKLDSQIRTYQIHLKRLQSEIDSATDIYQNIIKLNERIFSLDLSWRHKTLASLGGDFIDIREMEDSIDIIIADVAGHDIGSSFHTIILKAFFEENCQKGNDGYTLFRLLNQHILNSTNNDRMITGIFLRIHLKTLTCEIVSAAHPWIILMKKDSTPCHLIDRGGDVLGIMENPEFICKNIILSPLDRLFVLTDGVLDVSRFDEISGIRKRLENVGFDDLLMKYRENSLEDMISGVWQGVLDFCDNKPKDDMLFLGIEIPETPTLIGRGSKT